MYSYGWREYMPEIGRWNGIDQLAESYLSTSTYAYVANNPVLRFDVDGRWFNDDGTIDTSGRTPSFTSGKQYRDSFLGSNRNDGSGGAGGGTLWVGDVTPNNGMTTGDLIDAWLNNNSTNDIFSMANELIDNLYEDMDAETAQKQQTKEILLKDRIAKLKLKQRISGDDLKKIIPELKGIKYIEKVSATKFKVESTFLGSAMISDDAYLEIRPNSPIQGIGNLDGKPFSAKGIYIKVVGISGTASITVGDHKTQSFVVVGNKGMFKIGNKIIAFDL